MRILHIIRNPNDETPIEIARSQSEENEVAVLLLHDGVYANPDVQCKIYACAADAEARDVAGHECVDFKRIIQMLFEFDKVVSW
jgi:sulfur transfer complex TusBCD TusB component (DsrH family)